MLVDLPTFKRCCFCCPLRRGILVFGYLTLVVTCLFIGMQVLMWQMFKTEKAVTTMALYRGVVMEAQYFVIFILYALDLVFNIVLIIGAHLLSTMIASFLVVMLSYHDIRHFGSLGIALTELSIAFTGFVLQIYLLLLIRSELSKDRYQEGRSSFTNHIAQVFVDPPLRRQWTREVEE
ncbi:uncharacterized protein LOC113503852 isoform X2 [Trichoplusia ni]|uniref:Uncharacterized protein LOC113503852 isoform X2 n=1 Tax=Trichoplusia ni TaxID=7111 RepID=A0A7E5WM57_TRINI|nr:uncharacterized protein LOC113503852 isoform X2 [Trichoplusia ni]